jgi:hypothetical protein
MRAHQLTFAVESAQLSFDDHPAPLPVFFDERAVLCRWVVRIAIPCLLAHYSAFAGLIVCPCALAFDGLSMSSGGGQEQEDE